MSDVSAIFEQDRNSALKAKLMLQIKMSGTKRYS
jgi:uncharacterized protein with GYD domain